jgi:hypothetical protein
MVSAFHARYPNKPGPNVSLSEIAPREGGCHEQPRAVTNSPEPNSNASQIVA